MNTLDILCPHGAGAPCTSVSAGSLLPKPLASEPHSVHLHLSTTDLIPAGPLGGVCSRATLQPGKDCRRAASCCETALSHMGTVARGAWWWTPCTWGLGSVPKKG